MSKISRRSLLRGMLATGAAGAAYGSAPLGMRRALAGPAADPVFPTIFIHLSGGLDTAMHYDARLGFVNRDVQAVNLRTTAAGVVWNTDTMPNMQPHMEDAVVLRNVSISSSHPAGKSLLWFGQSKLEDARLATPWTNYMASDLSTRLKVPAANLVTYTDTDDEITNLIDVNNSSPNPLGAAQRVRSITDFVGGLDVLLGQPAKPFQERVFQHIARMDTRLYSAAVQERTLATFGAANSQATELLTQEPPKIWPPDDPTRALFDLSDSDISATLGQGNQRFNALIAYAYQATRFQVAHVVSFVGTQGGYDSHNDHSTVQRNRSNFYFPKIANLLSALKNTPSPVVAELTMFDTTHVVITSELSRANREQGGEMQDGNPFDGSGTPHWPWTAVLAFGGRFKRGYAFGDMDGDYKGIPTDLNTGELGTGVVPNTQNVAATIMAANRVDPAGWTDMQPINAVLGS